MCGICGIVGGVRRESIEAMVSAMNHRGPDDRGIYLDPSVALGMARLAILDPSHAGRQPMANRQHTVWIVYNGEAYNFRSERKILEDNGYRFSSSSDTEVVLGMYEHYGDDFLLRLRGMFALAILDGRRGSGHERLLLARDPLGIKPLLYTRQNGRFLFASELKALLASGLVRPEVDPISLRVLLTFGSIYQPRTILRGVHMLPPAHRLILEDGRERVERYWSLGTDRTAGWRDRPHEELVGEMAGLLEESVRLHLASDVPLGAFLSGGVDSSVLVALMARLSGHRVKTFSVGFDAMGSHIDESEAAERTARHIGTEHTRVLVTGRQVLDRIEHVAFSLDQPSVDGVNSYFISWAARQAVSVALSGTGGDEIFAGYPWFASMLADSQRLKSTVLDAGYGALQTLHETGRILNDLIVGRSHPEAPGGGSHVRFLSRFADQYHIFGARGAAQLISRELAAQAQIGRPIHLDLDPIDELPEAPVIERVSALCLRGYTNNQLLRDIDAVSMAHSLEVRVPYLDRAVVDAALSLPESSKIGDPSAISSSAQISYRDTGAKRILVDIGRPLLVDGFDLQPKRGFGMPFDAWLKGPLRETLFDALSEPQVRHRGLLDPHEVTATREKFLDGKVHWSHPWLLMMVELWCRQVLEAPISALARTGDRPIPVVNPPRRKEGDEGHVRRRSLSRKTPNPLHRAVREHAHPLMD